MRAMHSFSHHELEIVGHSRYLGRHMHGNSRLFKVLRKANRAQISRIKITS
jgi:hypothetical protein